MTKFKEMSDIELILFSENNAISREEAGALICRLALRLKQTSNEIVSSCETCGKIISSEEDYMVDSESVYFHKNGECNAWMRETLL